MKDLFTSTSATEDNELFSKLEDTQNSLREKQKERKRRRKKGKKTKKLDEKIEKLSKKCKKLKKLVKAAKAEANRKPPARSVWDEVIIKTAPIVVTRAFDLLENRGNEQ